MKKNPHKKPETRMTLRLPASLYEALKTAAAEDGLPLNTYCLYILARHDIYTAKNTTKLSQKKEQKNIKKT